jgi:signal transduction histidine kinase
VGGAAAADLIIERSYFEDPTGEMELAQVIHAPFKPTSKVLDRGFSRSAFWLRLVVKPPAQAGQLVLNVTPSTIDKLSFFLPKGDGFQGYQQVGLDFGSQEQSFAWMGAAGAPVTTYYVRVTNRGSLALSAEVLSESDFRKEELNKIMFFGAVTTCIAMVILGLLLPAVTRFEPLHLCLLVNLMARYFVFLVWFGHLQKNPNWAGLVSKEIYHFVILIDIASANGFQWFLLQRAGMTRWMRQIGLALGALMILIFLLFPFLDRQWLLQITFALSLCSVCVLLCLQPLVYQNKRGFQLWIGVLATLMLAWAVFAGLLLFGIVAPQDRDINLPAWRMLTAPLSFGVLAWMLERNRRDEMQMTQSKEMLANQLAYQESEKRQVQERFMTMLMHEVKTPLSIIQLAAASLNRNITKGSDEATRIQSIDKSVDDLNALVERCAQAEKLAQGAENPQIQEFGLQTLIGDVLESMDSERIEVRGHAESALKSDYQYLRVILLNLLGNGLKYSAPGSTVVFHIEPEIREGVKGLEFRIENQVGAAGLPDMNNVFSRYYRAEGARSKMGAGLGLWLAQEIARQLGTEIYLRNSEDLVVFGLWVETA